MAQHLKRLIKEILQDISLCTDVQNHLLILYVNGAGVKVFYGLVKGMESHIKYINSWKIQMTLM